MNTSSTQESSIRYFYNWQSAGVWVAMTTLVAVIGGGSSLAQHSFKLTSGLLIGTVLIAFLGYRALSRSCYFISADKAGFKDAFRLREVQFDEIQAVTKNSGRDSITLVFDCKTRIVTMPLDPLDEGWFSAVKAELHKRGIPISSIAFGLAVKEE